MNRSFRFVARLSSLASLAAALLLLHSSAALGSPDEGMWTFDNPPLARLKEKYGFEATPAWLDHVRLSSVRFNSGGSGSFVSEDGLVLTNHHVALDTLQKVSSEANDYVKRGFYAKSQADELPCPDLELNVLLSIEDVTARVLGAVKPDATPKDANDQRKAETARIEKEETEKTGSRCDVIPLYQGSVYSLYRFKKYKEVKLVFAPEKDIAFFGGDPDNFNYPRYDLDFAVFRAYENGKPVHTANYLKWNPAGAKDGDLVFVSGHPGRTSRLLTLSQVEYQRDYSYPRRLKILGRLEKTLRDYSARGPEQERRAKEDVFGIENSLKASEGENKTLQDEHMMTQKAEEEKSLRDLVAKDPLLASEASSAWDAIAKAQDVLKTIDNRRAFSAIRLSDLFTRAQSIVRLTAELEKKNEDRLPEYRDSALDSLKFTLFSPAPIYPDLEEAGVADSLAFSQGELGADDPFVKAALGGKTPAEVAKAAVGGTKLADVAFRKGLVDGGRKAVEASDDPMVQLARRVDPITRELRKKYEDEVESVVTVNGDKIGKVRFKVYGRSSYPDATFTLRLSYGTVKGYETAGGYMNPPTTTFYGLYERAYSFGNKPPFALPERWVERKGSLNLATNYDFVCSADIIGGNSGSPVVNRNGELVGLIFDGNIESLEGNFVFDESVNRAVAVQSCAILEALRDMYQASPLVDALMSGGSNSR